MVTVEHPGWTLVRRRWPGDPGAPGGRPNRVGFDYDAYEPAELGTWDPPLPASLAAEVAAVETAVRELARLTPSLGTLVWPLLRTEAIASSRIEGLVVSHHRLALAGVGATEDPLAQAVLANLDALREALDAADAPPTVAGIRAVHRALLAGTAQRAIAGRLRTTQNWIGGRHPYPRGAAFIPPPPDQVERLLGDLARFCARDDLPPLVQAAIAHVQFETIHPFADGNGRVGRALIPLVLRRRGVALGGEGAPPVLPPVSLVLAADDDVYIEGLTAFRAGDHLAWLRYFLSAVHRSVLVAEAVAAAVAELQERWRAAVGSPRRDSAAARLITRLPERPVVDLAAAVALTGVSAEATRRAIDRLVGAGVLRELTGRRRRRRWEAVGLFMILDEIETAEHPGRWPRVRASVLPMRDG